MSTQQFNTGSPAMTFTEELHESDFDFGPITFGGVFEFQEMSGGIYGITVSIPFLQNPLLRQELEITELASDEPYTLRCPMKISLIGRDGEYTASQWEINIHATGETEVDAIDNLKSLILDIFETLEAEPSATLGPKPSQQLTLLRKYINGMV